jgi:hypothetical protein
MKLMLAVAASATIAAVPTEALADEFYAVTPSGAAEAIFAGKPEATSSALSNQCINLGWTVVSAAPNTVTCEAPMSFGQSLAGTLLMGNRYSTPPRQFYRFNIVEHEGRARVQLSGWMELQMAFGQMRRTDFSGAPFHNSAMNLLIASGGKFPVGTSFPNHAVIGVTLDSVETPTRGARVTFVDPGSAGEVAGIQTGDVITRIARTRVQNAGNIFDGLAKAAKGASYPVEIVREGKKITLTLERRFHPAAGAPDWSEEEIANHTEQKPTINPMSIADELAKFAKLRDDGVITVDEFEAQKAKLLTSP